MVCLHFVGKGDVITIHLSDSYALFLLHKTHLKGRRIIGSSALCLIISDTDEQEKSECHHHQGIDINPRMRGRMQTRTVRVTPNVFKHCESGAIISSSQPYRTKLQLPLYN